MSIGLLAKPMLVTLPFTLLLLDIWPLRRVTLSSMASWRTKQFRLVITEKLPLLAITLVSIVLTLLAQTQGQALVKTELIPMTDRLANAVISYAAYLGKTVYPDSLSFFYPFRESWGAIDLLGSLVLLGILTTWAWTQRTSRPVLLFGWLWYLTTLIPVIGLVQVGSQAMADRYTYVPLIGIFVAIAWMIPEPGISPLRRTLTTTGTLIDLPY